VHEGLRTRAIITAGSGFRAEAYEGLPPLKIFSVHGVDDDLVPIEAARASFEKVREMGYGEEFYPMPGVKHGLDDAGRAVVRGWLEQSASRANSG
jgi:predicted esterase